MYESDPKPLVRVATDRTGQRVVVRSILRRDLTLEHLERMVKLLQAGFGEWPAFDPGVPPVDHLRWKIETPFARVAAIAAEIGGELVGTATVLTLRAKVGDHEFPRTRGFDQTVHPDYRGRGIASLISLVNQDAVPRPKLRITETHSQALLHLARKAGARVIGNPVLPLLHQLRIPVHARTEASSALLKAQAIHAIGAWNRLLHRRRHTSSARPRTLTRFDEGFDTLWKYVRDQFDVILVRTPDYLNW